MAQTYIDVNAAIEAAKQALAEKQSAMDKVAIIRTDLRNAVTLGATTPEQTKWIEEQFPLRERETDPAAKVQKLREQLAQAEKAARPVKAAA